VTYKSEPTLIQIGYAALAVVQGRIISRQFEAPVSAVRFAQTPLVCSTKPDPVEDGADVRCVVNSTVFRVLMDFRDVFAGNYIEAIIDRYGARGVASEQMKRRQAEANHWLDDTQMRGRLRFQLCIDKARKF
jgi:hypothetical protein